MILNNQKITYVVVPKCACTSLKDFFFWVDNGFQYREFDLDGRRVSLHRLTQAVRFKDLPQEKISDHLKVAVVRPPVERIVSCYQNKVLSGLFLENAKVKSRLKLFGINPEPSFNEFVEKLSIYRRLSGNIRKHSQPLEFFLGDDPSWYDRIFSIREMDQLEAWVREKTGSEAVLKRRNASKEKVEKTEISQTAKDLINRKYASDFELFGQFFGETSKLGSAVA